MKMSQGDSLYSYFKQKKKYIYIYIYIYIYTYVVTCFSFTKLENRKAEQVLSRGVGTGGRRENVEKECRGRVNMVQILCILVYKWKNEIC
jgi:hypothetical protein